ncbi:glycoside hydrolase family 1 protein [Nonomuraea sp. SMC257]|uniref:Glycoside hydrolase family 1 protein n=1 Tax=Nonomuraea montanisoli TaxID=2741721 RepID=A0A7Y6M4T3_9ACTN|nr:family 1 glycosylhydrolase [Nonomuraea montanisoli]NUW34637.1 glycoside hydrolase family 1 protein [Nonomuraea montanisoli]
MNAHRLSFPADFLWGAATAAHQIEGNNINSDWWHREHHPETDLEEPSGDACDSYHRYREDIGLLAGLGLNTYRFSIEWARIEPEQGFVSRAAVDHYRRMVDACHDAGLTPMVTLHHFTVPRWVEALGAWGSRSMPDLFARYTEAVLPVVADGVEWVCTINEPNGIAYPGGTGVNPLKRAGVASGAFLTEQLFKAHQASRSILSSVPGVKSGWAVATQAYHVEPGCESVWRDYGYPRDEHFLELAKGDDFVGVQAYTRTFIGPEGPRGPAPDVEKTLTGWEYFPEAAAFGVRSAWRYAQPTPVLVTENGIATADDRRRIDYTADSLAALHECLTDGIDLRGYLHWSALDNYEWGSFRPTFGLIAVDRTSFRRTVKPSARWLGEVARNGRLDVRSDEGRA